MICTDRNVRLGPHNRLQGWSRSVICRPCTCGPLRFERTPDLLGRQSQPAGALSFPDRAGLTGNSPIYLARDNRMLAHMPVN